MDRQPRTILERDNPWMLDPGARNALIRSKLPKDFTPRTLIRAARSSWKPSSCATPVTCSPLPGRMRFGACCSLPPALSRSSRSFIEAYRPSAFFVTSREYAARDRIGSTEVRWIQPQEVASAVGELPGP